MTLRLALVWLRAAARRPGRGLLVVSGLLAMVLAVAAAAVATDSLEQVLVSDAKAQWGPVDVTVSAPGGQLMDEGLARLVGSEATSRAWAGRLTLPAVAGRGHARDPHARLIGVSEEERSFTEPLTGSGTLRTAELGHGEVILNERLARSLDATTGDQVELMIAVPHTEWRTASDRVTRERDAAAVAWQVSVAGIADDAGLADLGRTPNVLTRLAAAQRVLGLEGKISALHAAAIDDTATATDHLVGDLEEWADRLGLVVTAVEREALEIADDESGQFVGIFASLALLVMLGSTALTVNLLVLLGHERAKELALLRSAGARRRTVVALLSAEGVAYTVLAAIAGVPLAAPLGELVARQVAAHFAEIELGRGREFLALSPDVRPATLAIGAGLVLVFGAAAAVLAARRVAALDMEHVLRGLPPTVTRRTGTPSLPVFTAIAGALLLGMGITAGGGADFLLFAGLTLMLTAVWLRARRVATDPRRTDAVAATAGLVWFVAAPAAFGDFARGVESAFALLAAAGAGAVICATVLAGTRLRTAMRLLRGFLPRRRIQAATRTAGAWAEQHKARSGTVVGLVAMVLFMVGVMSVLGRTTAVDLDHQGGGLDVIGTAVGPIDARQLGRVSGVGELVAWEHTTIGERSFAAEDADGSRSELRWPVRLIRGGHELATTASFELAAAHEQYATTAAALRGVVTDEAAVVLDRYSTPAGARPGARIVLDLGAGEEEFELAAILDTYVLGGVIINPARYDRMVVNRGPTLVLATAATATSAEALAGGLDRAGSAAGLTTLTAREAVRRITEINTTFTDLFAAVLQVGLVVALCSVGAVVSRASRERRAEFALLRALGFRRGTLAVAVIAEPVLLGIVGIVIGITAGLGTLALLFRTGFGDLAFQPHWGQLGATAALALTLIATVSLVPAALATRRPLAADLRDLG